jgi:hypothetical protein
LPRLLKAFAAIVGPAAVMAAGTMGAGLARCIGLAALELPNVVHTFTR